MAKETNLVKEFVLALVTLVGILAFLAVCGAGGYFYGEMEGRREVLTPQAENHSPAKVIAQIKESPMVQSLVSESTQYIAGSNKTTNRTLPYPKVDAAHLDQIGLIKEPLPPDNAESIPDTLQILGDQSFFKGSYAEAKSYYLRSIAVNEAVAMRIYDEQKTPTIAERVR